jgi:transcriptional regulator with XRE-family HTH domain
MVIFQIAEILDIPMRVVLQKASEAGVAVRVVRKAQGLRQDDAAGGTGVGESFMVRVENGAETVRWDKLFQVLEGLGIRVVLESPDISDEAFLAEQSRLAIRQARKQGVPAPGVPEAPR